MKSPYEPSLVKIKKIVKETSDVKTFYLDYYPEYEPGQFFEVGVLGIGEAPFTVASSPTEDEFFMSIKKVGCVTKALHKLKVGDKVSIRGPYGNSFPFHNVKGKHLLFIGGGVGLPPMRSQIERVLASRDDFRHINIIYGARDEKQIIFSDELRKSWPKIKRLDVDVCVDCKKGKCTWPENICLVPELMDIVFKKNPAQMANTIVFVCGPPIMIKFVIEKLKDYQVPDEFIITTLERQMKCGIGKCGHCNIGHKYVCVDGPVFSYKEIKKIEEPV